MRALISVSDKSGVIAFAKELKNLGYEIISTGGTLKALALENIDAIDVSEVTKFPEMFDGRVKTLNPYIHGGILYRRDNEEDVKLANEYKIKPIDIVVVNLYPFVETTKKSDNFDDIIENIDIGGPTLVRATAKNFKHTLIVTSPNDYKRVIQAIKDGENSEEFRREFMIKAFEHTAMYDSYIANYMNERFNYGFGEKHFIVGSKAFDTRYGENPHQRGALYQFEEFFTKRFKTLKGEVSFNNLTDINGAVKLATAFGEAKAVCIVKHGNPCGFAVKDKLIDSYKEALKCDPVSAYGGVVAINGVLDKELAEEINKTYIEVIIAGRVTKSAMNILETKRRIKIFEQDENYLTFPRDKYNFKHIEGGFVFQESDRVLDSEVACSTLVSKKEATLEQLKDLEIAYKVASLTKSNCVVYVKDGAVVAIGMGMTSRVDASICAIRKAKEMGLSVEGAVLASEAFFPFRDSIDMAHSAGVVAIIEPGGSIRDEDVINASNEHNIALYFSGIRHFLH